MPIVFKALAQVPAGTGPTPPGQVTGLAANALSSSSINLTWNATSGATLYKIFRNGLQISTDTASPFLDSGLSPSTTYTYNITANNALGDGPQSAPASATTFAASSAVKWNPGHYGASAGIADAGATLATFSPEMDAMLTGHTAIKGYRLWISWGLVNPSDGVFDFTLLDAVLNRLKTQYGRKCQLYLTLLACTFNGTYNMAGTNGSRVPTYIQNNSAYGPSPYNTGRTGVWGFTDASGNALASPNGIYAAAIWRQSVMDKLIATVNALGAHLDSDVNFEGIMFQETDAYVGPAQNGTLRDGTYSDAAFSAQLLRLENAAQTAFPTSNVALQFGNFHGDITLAQQHAQDMQTAPRRICPSNADVIGDSKFTDNGLKSWGLSSYAGFSVAGGTWTGPDRRPIIHSHMDVESPDMGGSGFGTRFFNGSPSDLLTALNNRYKASHAFWAYMPNNTKVNITFNSAPQAGATSGTIGGFTGATGTYGIQFSDGEVHLASLTQNSGTATWSGGLTNAVTTAAVAGINPPTTTRWDQLVIFLTSNPLTNIGYPSIYP